MKQLIQNKDDQSIDPHPGVMNLPGDCGSSTGRRGKDWQDEYNLVYEDLFAPYRNNNVSLLEIGVDSAVSMKVWGEYFTHPKARFTGVMYGYTPSKDFNITKSIFRDRTKIIHSTINFDLRRIEALRRLGLFSIIVDGGSHAPSGGGRQWKFSEMWSRLARGGIYVMQRAKCDGHDMSSGLFI